MCQLLIHHAFVHQSQGRRANTRATQTHQQNTTITYQTSTATVAVSQDLDMLMTRESPTEVPQYYVTHFSEGGSVRTERKISDFPHPYPTVRHVYHCRLAAFCVFSVPATGHQVSIIRSRISTTTSPLDLPHRQQMVMPSWRTCKRKSSATRAPMAWSSMARCTCLLGMMQSAMAPCQRCCGPTPANSKARSALCTLPLLWSTQQQQHDASQ